MPPKSLSPSSDQIAIGIGEHERDQEAVAHVAHHRVHRHAGMAAVPVRLVGALDRGVVVRGGERLVVRERVADVPGHRAPGAVVAALLDPAPQAPRRTSPSGS